MVNKHGKTSVVFLVVFGILFLSLAAIMIFLFQKEREIRKDVEVKNNILQEKNERMALEIERAKNEIFILEARKKEIEEKIEGLLDDLDLEKGLRRELKNESIALSQRAEALTKRKNELQDEVIALSERISAIQEQLENEKALREEAEKVMKELKMQSKARISGFDVGDDVALEKIVVTPDKDLSQTLEGQEGRVLRVNVDNNFIIISLGRSHFIEENSLVTIFRDIKVAGQGTVASIQQNMSVVDLLPPLSAGDIAINDKVVVHK